MNFRFNRICSRILRLAALTGSVFAAHSAAPLIVGFERFHTGEASDLVAAGELLIGELGCVNCHKVSGDWVDRFPVRAAPSLEGIGDRVNHDWLAKWLSDPHATKPGTVMPDLLAGRKTRTRKSLSTGLAHFLVSLKSDSDVPATEFPGDADAGRQLFHSIGCVACHEPEKDFQPDDEFTAAFPVAHEVPSVPIGNVGMKYNVASLAVFLRDPLKVRPSARMPRFPLSEQEAVDLARYLISDKVASGKSIRPGMLKKWVGRSAFASLGCAACHRVKTGGKWIQSRLSAEPLSDLAPTSSQGCLSPEPLEKVPFYNLSERQRAALVAALKNLVAASNVSISERARNLVKTRHVHPRKLMTALNCFACHKRGDLGGPEPGRAIYFHTTGQDLEDEGRFPPNLTGVGRKLRPDAMDKIIQGDGAVRPYMTTRMPDFGEAYAAEFALIFPTLDIPVNEKPTPRDGEENQVGRNMWGRALMGTSGLGCVSCHDLNGTRSLGIRAMDLAHAQSRLRPEWFRDYLIDPAKFRPGTRMPSFWPEGKPIAKGNGGSTSRQIDSIWVYLNEIAQSRLPVGLEKSGNFELKPMDRPIVFRTFMETAGLHAIAVGFPQGIHAAFNSKNAFWALLWRGRFLDAESTWDNRFTPLAKPLSEDVFQPNREFPIAEGDGSSRGEVVFRGYRLAKDGSPIMLYDYAGLAFEDSLTPSNDGHSMRQTIRVNGPRRPLIYRSKIVVKGTPNSVGKWSVISPKNARVTKHETGDVTEFWVPFEFETNNEATLILEWTW